jgi:predicted transposase YbfD/YdcC
MSTPWSAARFSPVVRQHWGLENGLPWVLEVTMNEDQARHRKDHGPENLALLRRLALKGHVHCGATGTSKGID